MVAFEWGTNGWITAFTPDRKKPENCAAHFDRQRVGKRIFQKEKNAEPAHSALHGRILEGLGRAALADTMEPIYAIHDRISNRSSGSSDGGRPSGDRNTTGNARQFWSANQERHAQGLDPEEKPWEPLAATTLA